MRAGASPLPAGDALRSSHGSGRRWQPLRFEVASVKPNKSGAYAAGLYKLAPHELYPLRYDIVATKPTGATEEQERTMLQKLLVERFELKLHWEKRRTTVLKMGKVVSGSAVSELKRKKLPVIDTTGIAGFYNFTLKWKPDPETKPAVLNALHEQLGLRREPRRTELDYLSIESANKVPSDN